MLAFYAFPAEDWIHLKTTNSIKSTIATVRPRTKVTKGSHLLVTLVRAVVTFEMEVMVHRSKEQHEEVAAESARFHPQVLNLSPASAALEPDELRRPPEAGRSRMSTRLRSLASRTHAAAGTSDDSDRRLDRDAHLVGASRARPAPSSRRVKPVLGSASSGRPSSEVSLVAVFEHQQRSRDLWSGSRIPRPGLLLLSRAEPSLSRSCERTLTRTARRSDVSC
jgi:hypothetical protein